MCTCRVTLNNRTCEFPGISSGIQRTSDRSHNGKATSQRSTQRLQKKIETWSHKRRLLVCAKMEDFGLQIASFRKAIELFMAFVAYDL